MSKDATSFLHYSGARNDESILKLRSRFGWEGYGIYFAILEMLREADDQELELEYCYLAFALHTTEDKIRDILSYILELNLFKVNSNKFYSEGMKERVEAFNKKKEIYRQNALGKGKKAKTSKKITTKKESNNNSLEQKASDSEAIAEPLLSESIKEKEIENQIENENNKKEIAIDPESIKKPLDKYPLIKLSKADMARVGKKYISSGLDRDDIPEALEIFSDWCEANQSLQKYKTKKDHAACLNGWVLKELLERRRKLMDFERSKNYLQNSRG